MRSPVFSMRLASLPAHCTGNGTLTEDVQFGYATVCARHTASKARQGHGYGSPMPSCA